MIRDRVMGHLAKVCADADALPSSELPTVVGMKLDLPPIGGRFVPISVLGEGGMAVVYRAIDLETGSEVALKVPNLLGSYTDRRFKMEVEALGRVASPSIVGFVGNGTPEEPYLAMELIRGRSLAQRVISGGPLDAETALAVGRRIASALAAIHLSGWVHRDIKPGNVVMTADGSARLVDFGLARPLEGTGAGTKAGQIVGTLSYLAPEQLGDAAIVDSRCDVFALGCLLFEMVTGQSAFRRTLESIFRGDWARDVHPRLDTDHPLVPRALAAVIDRFTAIDQFDRPMDGLAALGELLAVDPAFDASPLSDDVLANGVRDIVAASLRGAIAVTGAAGAGKTRCARAAALLLAEIGAPSRVAVIQGNPRLTRAKGGHLQGLGKLLDDAGLYATSRVLSGDAGAADAPHEDPSFVLLLDDASFLDSTSLDRIRTLAERRHAHVIVTVRPGANVPESFARVHLRGHGQSPQSTLDELPRAERALLDIAAAFGSLFDERRLSLLYAGANERTLVGGVGPLVAALVTRGILRRLPGDRLAFARAGLWEQIVSVVDPEVLRANVDAATQIDGELLGALGVETEWAWQSSAVCGPAVT